MSNHKDHANKVSHFPGRIKAANEEPKVDTGPSIGGDQGMHLRNACGGCLSWKRRPEMGLNQGVCMYGPPAAFPVQGPNGQHGQMLIRPTLTADYEGCDQFDDGTDEETDGDGTPVSVSKIAQG